MHFPRSRQLTSKVRRNLSTIRTDLQLRDVIGRRTLFLAAGMQRSGSTLLFNILREALLDQFGNSLSCAFIGDLTKLNAGGSSVLIKTHRLSKLLISRAESVVYSYRDPRDAAVSQMRKFGTNIDLGFFRNLIRQHEFACHNSVMMIRYDNLVSDPIQEVADILQTLSLELDPEKVYTSAVSTMSSSAPGENSAYDPVTLLHNNHRTGTLPKAWKTELATSLLDEAHREYEWYFRKWSFALD